MDLSLSGRAEPRKTHDDEILLLSPYKGTETKSPELPGEIKDPGKASNSFAGITPNQRRYGTSYETWNAYKLKPWNMCLLAVLGTMFAIAHHLFYLSLNGTEASDQSLMLRYGTIIAFCAKACLGAAVSMAFQQRAWLVVRHKMARLETVDSIFTANTNIFSLFSWSSIKKAKVGSLLALYCWVTPLVVVLTSETLSVVNGNAEELVQCPSVRTLNFDNEARNNWRGVNVNDIKFLSHYNTTSRSTKPEDFNSTHFDYWTGPNTRYTSLVANKAIFMREPLFRDDSAAEVCSEGWNCSYVVDFLAPGYKCEELASGVGAKVKDLGYAKAPFNTSSIAPEGNLTYLAWVAQEDYATSRGPGVPRSKDLGIFQNEPIIWIGYSKVEDMDAEQPTSRDQKGWDQAFTPVIFGCEHYEVNYTVRFDYVRGTQSYKIKKRDYVRKVVNTTYMPVKRPGSKKSKMKAIPESNYVLPSDSQEYRRIAAYRSIGWGLRHYLQGSVNIVTNQTTADILLMSLSAKISGLPVKDLAQRLQKLYEDVVVSLLAEPSFTAVSWASNGKPSGVGEGDKSTIYPCRRQRQTTVFSYNMVQLLTVYAVSISLAIVGVLLGIQAYREEGVMRDLKPSSIIEASRASNLDTLGTHGEVRIGYGLVHDEAGRSVRSFGMEGNVTQQQARL